MHIIISKCLYALTATILRIVAVNDTYILLKSDSKIAQSLPSIWIG